MGAPAWLLSADMPLPATISLASDDVFHRVRMFQPDDDLARALQRCIEAQRRHLADERGRFVPVADAEHRVSPAALVGDRTEGQRSDLRTDPDLSNCLVFHTGGLPGSVDDPEVVKLREVVDGLLRDRLCAVVGVPNLRLRSSGHFWYPPGSYMGWHTNARVPGWRAYVTYAEVPDRSFFRYAHPETGEIVTTWDDGWDLRIFRVDSTAPFWHTVYSGTNRYSFGYQLDTGDPTGAG